MNTREVYLFIFIRGKVAQKYETGKIKGFYYRKVSYSEPKALIGYVEDA